jgi:dihydropteroate synthase
MQWSGCAVMGIVNVTPDSFSDGGLHQTHSGAISHGRRMVEAGALMVDIGGESTRPGAAPVAIEEELSRIVPVIEALASDGNIIISVDTYKAEVAMAALAAGAHLVNDVSGLGDPQMASACGSLGAPMIIMHMKGTPQTMQVNPVYDDVVSEVVAHLAGRAAEAIACGVPTVLIDPGVGFGKNLQHNLALLRAVPFAGSSQLTSFPVVIGASRKRMIGEIAGVERAVDRDPGSLAVHLHSARRGAAMVRVHDVAAHVQALAVAQSLI